MSKTLWTFATVIVAASAGTACGTRGSRPSLPPSAVDSRPYAVVTTREAVFAFPIVDELMGPWPPAAGVRTPSGYAWAVRTGGYERPVVLTYMVLPDTEGRIPAFASLDAVLRGGSLRSCYLDHFWWCAVLVPGSARAEGRRAVVRLRDSALVAALRAHRPRAAEFIMDRFDRRVLLDSAVIRYTDP